jgi:energy coupling factor transporter S component ThiW
MSHSSIKKLAGCAMIAAIGVIGATLAVPVGITRCYPMQSFLNILTAILFGPGWAVLTAFVISLLRNLLGLGTIMAFPGSMFGALLAGLMYKWKPKSLMACLGELVGTGLIGSIAVYPIAKFVMGKDVAAFAYVVPFSLAAVVGAVCAMAVILLLERTGAMKKLRDTAE